MRKLTRTAPGAAIALVLALAAAVPAAAVQPTKNMIYIPQGTRTFDPGAWCAFAVTRDRPSGFRLKITDFSDGREQVIGLAVQQTFTNPANGKSFVAQVSGHEVDWFDAYPVVRGTAQGEFIWQSLPGDVGPGGVIVDQLTEFYIRGSVTYVANWETGATSEFSLTGTATDMCAELS
jgi:hypothetical protein